MSTYNLLYNELIEKIRSTRRKETALSLASGLMTAIAISLFLLTIFSLIESFAFFGVVFRTIFALLWLGGSLGGFAVFAVKPILRTIGILRPFSDEEMADRVGRKFPDVDDKLHNALQLFHIAQKENGISAELALAAFGVVGERAKKLNFDVILDTDSRKRSMILFFVALLFSGISFGFFPNSVGSAMNRLLHFNKAFVPPAPFSLEVSPTNDNILRGQNTSILVKVSGKLMGDVILRLREEKQNDFDSFTLHPDSSGEYRYEIPSIKRGVEYFAEVSWYTDFVRSNVGKISVLDRPGIRSLSGTVTPPSYTHLAPKTLDENSADIMSLRGSAVNLQILSNKELGKAEIVILKRKIATENPKPIDESEEIRTKSKNSEQNSQFDTMKISMKTDDRRATGSFSVNFNGEYFISIADKNGEINPTPIHYPVTMLTDAQPTISLLEPTSDTEVNERAIVPMKVLIADDYGFSALKLNYRLTKSKYSQPDKNYKIQNMPLIAGERALEVPYLWDLNSLNISPEDTYEFFVEVFDNDIIGGPKSAKTSIISVRLPSLDEVFKNADKSQEMAAKDLEKVLKQAEEMRKEAEQVSRELRKQQPKDKMEWKEQKKIEDIAKKQEELAKKVEEVRKNLEQMTEKLQDNKAMSKETMEKYMQLQELMKKVNAPELMKQAQQMQKMMDKVTPQQMEQAMKNFQFDEEQFKKSIERTMNILKRVQANQKTDELTKRAQDLAKKQEDLQKQMENSNPNDKAKQQELAEQQKKLQEDLEKLNKEAKDLQDMMKELGKDMPQSEMQKAMDELQKDQTQEAMEQAKQEMQKGDQQKAKQQQKKAADNLKKFAQQMKKVKKEMEKNGKQEAMRQMRKAINNMLNLSKQQESLKEKSQKADANSSQFRDLAQKQEEMLQELNNIANQMNQLGQKSFSVTPEMGKEIGDAMRQMQQSIQQLENRNSQGSCQNQGNAMGSMNRSVMQMQSAMDGMEGQDGKGQGGEGEGEDGQSPGSGMGFMQRLQSAAMQQQMINQGMQQMMGQGGQGQNGQYSQEQQAEFGRLSAQQGKAQKAMEELAKEQKESGGKKKTLGDLDRLAKEMQEVVSDMKSGQITPETLKRQDRILSRLLDATRSSRERDYEKERESNAGNNMRGRSPKDLDLNTQEGKNRAMQELLKSVQEGYTKDYESLIRRYFETLQKTGGAQ